MSEADQSVLIIGAGLIGTSIGLALTNAGYKVYLRDAAPSHALVAAGLGAGSVEEPEGVDIVVVATPPLAAGVVVVEALAAHPGATVTDVASVKTPVLEAVRAAGGDLARYVGSHPMAGSHRSGPLTARADLFGDRTWVVAAGDGADAWRVDQVRALAAACGARLEVMTPAQHDLAVAEVSHVPQVVSSLMAGQLAAVAPANLRLAGQGVRDVTRIAASDPDMWTQIIVANRAAIRNQLDRLAADLSDIAAHLDCPDEVWAFLDRGIAGTRALPGKRGRPAGSYSYVVVEIPDSPGALARLFADIVEAGVNVEDLAIEHEASREVGYLSVAVEPDRAAGLVEAMTRAGWNAGL